jgi:RNA polymerase-interacting CarD/CdnL/TRCF family regulator
MEGMAGMDFQVGDKVVHWAYGPGEIIDLEEKVLSGHTSLYYVVQLSNLTLWVPSDDQGKRSMRLPTPPSEFENLFILLRSPGEPLPSDRLERKLELSQRMKDGTLESICRVIRDLHLFRRTQKYNESDTSTFERAQKFLLSEWTISLSIPVAQAEKELRRLLGSDLPEQK